MWAVIGRELFIEKNPLGRKEFLCYAQIQMRRMSKMAAPNLINDQIQQLLKQNELLIKQQSKMMSYFMNHSFKATSDRSDWIDDMGDTDTTHGFFSKFAKNIPVVYLLVDLNELIVIRI